MSATVSVIILVYNGGSKLRAALDSVREQTLLPQELIAVDDGSTDDSRQVLDEFTAPFPVRVIEQSNRGQSAARNLAARHATGELLAFLDQDDEWRPRHLEVLAAPFARHPDLGWCYSDFDEIDGEGYVVTQSFLREFGVRNRKPVFSRVSART